MMRGRATGWLPLVLALVVTPSLRAELYSQLDLGAGTDTAGQSDAISNAAINSPLTFNFNPTGTLAALQTGTAPPGGGIPADPAEQIALAANVMSAFQQAGDRWRNRLFDPITVNINVNYSALGTGILGTADSLVTFFSYFTIAGALVGDAMSADDGIATSNLQPHSIIDTLDFITNDTTQNPSPVVRDNGASANNTTLRIHRANAKALGLVSADNLAVDGTITIGSGVTWDFDPSDDISSDAFDLVGTAIHEMGHTLGFSSGVDMVDTESKGGDGLNGSAVLHVLDLFRYSTASLNEENQPDTGAVLDLSYGGDPYFSIDAGTTNLAPFSTGVRHGDGKQASHWKDDLGLGVLGPSLAKGALFNISPLDIQAFDVIGFDIPEPAAGVLVLIGSCLVAGSRPRRHL